MRILHVFDHSPPLQSGYVTRSLGLLRSQRARGWETLHVTASRHAAWTHQSQAFETFGDLTFYRTPQPSSTPLPLPIAEMKMLRRRLMEIVGRERPDIIHAHSPVLNVLPAIAVSRRFRVPIVYEVRAFWEDAAVDLGHSREGSPRYRLARLLDTWAMRRCDAVLPLSEAMRLELVARGIPEAKLTVIPNAVDEGFLTAATDTGTDIRAALGVKDRFVIGFIGSFYSYEGLDLLLEAMRLLLSEHRRVALLLVGGGPDEQRLRSIAERLQLRDAVHFIGRVPHDQVPRYYQTADLFAFPRRRMRLTELVTPLKPLETMAQSKPVAVSDVGGHRELVTDHETGFLFPADDANALARCIISIINNPVLTAQIAAKGRAYVERARSWRANSSRYAAIYERLLGGPMSQHSRQA